ncbi:hypothetical protein [Bradyrhizobium sp. AZCC 2262]|uniref:hypothetical protein n=1 Tax=Bradyrhizobium sp. AZCC 2262 TaxID=3117022 RepID=UPI002FF3471A
MVRTYTLIAGILLNEFSDLKRWSDHPKRRRSGVDRNAITFACEFGIKTVGLMRREEPVADLQAAGGDVVLIDAPANGAA